MPSDFITVYIDYNNVMAPLFNTTRTTIPTITKRPKSWGLSMPNQTSLFSAIFEGAGIGMLLVDPSGRVLKTNRVLQEWIGYSADELQSMTFDQFTFPEDITNDSDLFKALAQGKRTRYQVETRCIHKNGNVVWGRVTVSLVHPSKNDPILVFRIIEDINPRKQIELALAAQTNGLSYRAIFERTDIGIMVVDREGRVLESNSALHTMMAYTGDELSQFTFGDFTHPDDLDDDREQFEDLVQNRRAYYQIEKRLRREDGSFIWVRTTVVRIQVNPDYPQFAVRIVENITTRKQVEDAFHRAYRAYRTLSQVNNILLHATNEIQLLQDVCQLIVESGAYLMARVGFAAKDEQKSVFLAAHAGDEGGDLTGIAITWADTELGRGPTGTAIRTGQPSVVQHILTNPAYEPWRAEAIQRGYASSAALPLMAGHQAFGALTIYAPEPDAFSSDEIALLEELANDLAFGIITIRTRELHQRTKHALEASEARLRRTIETSTDAIISANSEGNIVGWNQAAETLFGYPVEEAIGQTLTVIMPKRYRPAHQAAMQQFLTTQRPSIIGTTVQVVGLRKDGSEFPIELSLTQWETGGEMFFTAIIRDITERAQAEQALLASETRYRRLFEAAQDGILILDADTGKVVDVNPFLLDLLGYPQQEILGKELWEIGFFKDITASQAAFLELQDNGYIRYQDLPLEARDGRRIEVEFVSNAYLVDGKQVIQCNIRDITDRKQAEEAVRFQTQFLNAVGEAVIALDLEGNVSFWNRFAETLYGWSAEEAMGRNIMDVTPADISRQQAAEILARMQAGETWSGEITLRRKDGATFPASMTNTPIVNEQGTQIGIIGTSINITDRIQAEEALRESEEIFRAFIDQSGDAIALTNSDGIIVEWNPALTRITGTSREQALGQPLWIVESWHSDDNNSSAVEQLTTALEAMIRQALAGETPPWLGKLTEMPIRHLDNTQRVVQSISFPINTQHHRMLGTIMRDITERKRIEETLREKTEELDRFFSLTLDLLCIANVDGYFLRLNNAWETTLGYRLEDLEGKRFLDFVHPDDLESTLGAIAELSADQQVLNFVNRYRCQDGSYRWIEWRSMPYQGRLIYAAARDITERRQMEEMLRQSEEQYRTLFDQSTNALLLCEAVIDEQGTPTDFVVLQTNRVFADSVNVRAQDMVGQHLTHVFPNIKDTSLFNAMIRTATTRQPEQLEFHSVSLSRDFDVGVFSPHQAQVATSYADITARKQVEEHKARLALEQEKARILQSFVEDVSHEFRTPLTVIHSGLQLLEQMAAHQRTQSPERIAELEEQTMYISDLVDAMLTMTKLDSVSSLPATATAINSVVATWPKHSNPMPPNMKWHSG